jgi:hypothetical protein
MGLFQPAEQGFEQGGPCQRESPFWDTRKAIFFDELCSETQGVYVLENTPPLKGGGENISRCHFFVCGKSMKRRRENGGKFKRERKRKKGERKGENVK